MDTWQELTIEVKREAEEAASNILIELGNLCLFPEFPHFI